MAGRTKTRRGARQTSKAASERRRRRPVATETPPADAPASLAPPAPVADAGPEAGVQPVLDVLPDATPERDFAERVPPPEPERPWPTGRRAVFFDVENSSHAPYIERMVQRLGIDRARNRTDFVAVGNWRVIGQDTARMLARHGAQLVHSAPSVGVRDWSDLRIAVSAGVWLASGRPGDLVEIVSDDRAFDAVGDVAAALGIRFNRLSYRAVTGAPAEEAPVDRAASGSRRRGRRSRRRGPGRPPSGPHPVSVARQPEARPVPPPAATPTSPAAETEPHTAPHDEIVHVVRELIDRAQGRAILIDTVARELKTRGFSRPPGSPRLITRLRRIKELAVTATGMISLTPAARSEPAPPRSEPAPLVSTTAQRTEEPDADAADAIGNLRDPADDRKPTPPGSAPARRGSRRRRRGGRGRRPAPARSTPSS
jgi:hypothetical protein